MAQSSNKLSSLSSNKLSSLEKKVNIAQQFVEYVSGAGTDDKQRALKALSIAKRNIDEVKNSTQGRLSKKPEMVNNRFSVEVEAPIFSPAAGDIDRLTREAEEQLRLVANAPLSEQLPEDDHEGIYLQRNQLYAKTVDLEARVANLQAQLAAANAVVVRQANNIGELEVQKEQIEYQIKAQEEAIAAYLATIAARETTIRTQRTDIAAKDRVIINQRAAIASLQGELATSESHKKALIALIRIMSIIQKIISDMITSKIDEDEKGNDGYDKYEEKLNKYAEKIVYYMREIDRGKVNIIELNKEPNATFFASIKLPINAYLQDIDRILTIGNKIINIEKNRLVVKLYAELIKRLNTLFNYQGGPISDTISYKDGSGRKISRTIDKIKQVISEISDVINKLNSIGGGAPASDTTALIRKLLESLDAYRNKIRQILAEKEQLLDEIQRKEDQLQQQLIANERLQADYRNLLQNSSDDNQRTAAAAMENIRVAQAETDRVRADLLEMQRKNTELETQLQNAQQEMQRNASASEDANRRYEQEIQRHRAELSALNDKCKENSEAAARKEAVQSRQIDDLKRELAQKNKDIDNLRANNERRIHTITDEAVRQVGLMTEKHVAAMDELMNNHAQELEQLESEITGLSNKLNDSSTKIENLELYRTILSDIINYIANIQTKISEAGAVLFTFTSGQKNISENDFNDYIFGIIRDINELLGHIEEKRKEINDIYELNKEMNREYLEGIDADLAEGKIEQYEVDEIKRDIEAEENAFRKDLVNVQNYINQIKMHFRQQENLLRNYSKMTTPSKSASSNVPQLTLPASPLPQELSIRLERLAAELEELKKTKTELEAEKVQLKNKIASLNNENNRLNAQNTALIDSNDTLEREKAELTEAKQSLERENRRLTDTLSRLQVAQQNISIPAGQIPGVSEEAVRDAVASIKKANEALEIYKAKDADRRRQFDDLEGSNNELRQEKESLREELERVNQELSSVKESKKEADAELARLQATSSTYEEKLQALRKQLKLALDTQQIGLSERDADNLAQAANNTARISALGREIQQLKSTIETLRSQESETIARAERAEARIRELSARAVELNQANARIDELTATVKKKDAEIERRLANWGEQRDLYLQKDSEVIALQREMDILKGNLQVALDNNKGLLAENTALQAKVGELSRRNNELNEKIRVAIEEKQKLVNYILLLEQILVALKRENPSLAASIPVDANRPGDIIDRHAITGGADYTAAITGGADYTAAAVAGAAGGTALILGLNPAVAGCVLLVLVLVAIVALYWSEIESAFSGTPCSTTNNYYEVNICTDKLY
jgi:chromosome segregation ATPase